MKLTANGHIKFIDNKKTEYNLDDIFELIEYNFGYRPYGKTKTKDSKEYRAVAQKIHRGLKGKELSTSSPRNTLYSKADVYKFLNCDAYNYFLKLTNSKEEYDKRVKEAQKEIREKMDYLRDLDSYEASVLKQKQEVILRIAIDYITNNLIDINEELIENDIYLCRELGGIPIEQLSDSEALIYNRLNGNVSEYYTVK